MKDWFSDILSEVMPKSNFWCLREKATFFLTNPHKSLNHRGKRNSIEGNFAQTSTSRCSEVTFLKPRSQNATSNQRQNHVQASCFHSKFVCVVL